MKMKMLSLTLIPLISGCASLGGNALYKYQKVGSDCTVTIDSGRILKAGATLELTDCNIKVSANSLEQGNAGVGDLTNLVTVLGNLIMGQKNDSTRSVQPTEATIGGAGD